MTNEKIDLFTLPEMLKRMSVSQWVIFLQALADVISAGYGTVTLEVKMGVVRRVVPAPSIELPDPNDEEKYFHRPIERPTPPPPSRM